MSPDDFDIDLVDLEIDLEREKLTEQLELVFEFAESSPSAAPIQGDAPELAQRAAAQIFGNESLIREQFPELRVRIEEFSDLRQIFGLRSSGAEKLKSLLPIGLFALSLESPLRMLQSSAISGGAGMRSDGVPSFAMSISWSLFLALAVGLFSKSLFLAALIAFSYLAGAIVIRTRFSAMNYLLLRYLWPGAYKHLEMKHKNLLAELDRLQLVLGKRKRNPIQRKQERFAPL